MSVRLIQDRLDQYTCKSAIEEEQALREITQEVVLAALGRTDFFAQAALQGGTCLRVFYGLNRFSEDLGFVLRDTNQAFDLKCYLRSVAEELAAYGYRLEIQDPSKAGVAVKKAFLKDDSICRVLDLGYMRADRSTRKIRVKLEVDTHPPSGSGFEAKFLDFPFVSSVVLQDLPSLFAGKLHALLCREYVKGRDWYDFIWYTGRSTGINQPLLASAIRQQGPWKDQDILVDKAWCVTELRRVIASIDWPKAAEDVRRFLRPNELPSLKHWSVELFLAQVEKMASTTS
jgi:predicted nucleotidyltransferase component of viral defense system